MFLKTLTSLRAGSLLALLSLSIALISSAQTWTGGSPIWKNIRAVTNSPTNANILYAGAFGWGVFKSTDGGTSWVSTKSGMVNTHVRSILAISDLTVFAGTNDGVDKTTNGGISWSTSIVTPFSVRGIAYDTRTNTLYAATYGSGLYKSTDLGTTWSHKTITDPSTGETMNHLRCVVSYGRDSIYVGGSILDISSGGALFKSVDGGTNWNQLQYPTGIRSTVRSIAISPNDPASGLIIGTAAKGVYKSTNGGQNWTEINANLLPNPIVDKGINAVGFNTTFRYAGTDSLGKFYYRSLGDTTVGWLSGTGLPGIQAVINSIQINASSRNIVFVGTEGQGVYKSIDSGKTWQSSNVGVLGTAGRTVKLNGNGTLILGTDFGDGIWRSTDQASSWTRAETLTTSNSITSIGITNNNSLLYAGDYGTGVYKSTDGGLIWHITDSTVINRFVRTLVVHPANSSIVYAGTGNGVFKTTNGGTSWFASNAGIPLSTSIRSMELDPTNANILYVGTDSIYMFKSTDAGGTWTPITNANGFLAGDRFIRSITVDHVLPNVVYAGVDSGRIYKSTNAGMNWSLLVQLTATHSVRSVLVHPANRNILFAATFGDGIFVSTDGGLHWSTFNSGLPDLEIYCLESDAATPLNLYAGTGSHGIFHTTYTVVNHPPVLAAIGNKTILAGHQLSFTVTASDPDLTVPSLSVHPLPTGATFFDSANGHGLFRWTPSQSQVGSYNVIFVASDGALTDSELVKIDVYDSVVNHPPVLAAIGNKAVLAGRQLSFTIAASDPDLTVPTLSAHPLPTGAAFIDSANGHGLFRWTPSASQVGTYNVTFVASDGSLADSQRVMIDVYDSSSLMNANVPVESGWNLLSVPVVADDFQETALFPSASSEAYGYSGRYIVYTTLSNGVGYWLKFQSPDNVSISGKIRAKDTVSVRGGWNIIGALSSIIPRAAVTPIPPVIIRSQVFGYSVASGYQAADSLRPGKGFWMKASQAGKIVFNSAGMALARESQSVPKAIDFERLVDAGCLNRVSFVDGSNNDRTLYFGSAHFGFDAENFELPPTPPEGCFDARFSTQRALAVVDNVNREFPILLTGVVPPLQVRWEVNENDFTYNLSLVEQTRRQDKLVLSGKGSFTIADLPVTATLLTDTRSIGERPPTEFALEQNYPNPFNPSTVLKYALPVEGSVKLTIFNLLGQETTRLVDGLQSSGNHSIVWDAEREPSGVYFSMLEVDDARTGTLLYRAMKKLVLVK